MYLDLKFTYNNVGAALFGGFLVIDGLHFLPTGSIKGIFFVLVLDCSECEKPFRTSGLPNFQTSLLNTVGSRWPATGW